MEDVLDLKTYPLHDLTSPGGLELVSRCRRALERDGMFNLTGFVQRQALEACLGEVRPVLETAAYVHRQHHNIYFKKTVAGLKPDHPALKKSETANRKICADQIPQSLPVRIYEWPPLAAFLAAVMDKPDLYPMADPLARVNVMTYRDGETLNWHFDRSEFTTTLLLQEPRAGGDFQYRSALRSDDDPNYDGVAELLAGRDNAVRTMPLEAGTLNVFKGKNTAHRVSAVEGNLDRIIAVFSYFESPGVRFSDEDQMRFYGRVA